MTRPPRLRKPRPAKRAAAPPARETILLVDDEAQVRAFLAKVLGITGYRVMVAADGEDALSMSEGFGGTIHLLITDVMMPNMNGKELADRLCALRPEIKVLFISGYRRADLWPDDVCEDVTDWLPKPFTPTQFHSKVREILDSVRHG
jgi:two-component system cell cycle sensor histidine kinase/response regulator CckA